MRPNNIHTGLSAVIITQYRNDGTKVKISVSGSQLSTSLVRTPEQLINITPFYEQFEDESYVTNKG